MKPEPSYTKALPPLSTMAQKVVVAQDTDSGVAPESTLLYGDQTLPPSVVFTTFPLLSKAMQKLAVGHETEAIPSVEAVSMRTPDDQLEPL